MAGRLDRFKRRRDRSGSGVVDDQPIFVIGCCHRTGSALLQRLITSIPDAFIWGENQGATSALLESRRRLHKWSDRTAGIRDEILVKGTETFMANATPDSWQIDQAYRSYFRDMYGFDVSGRPVQRWGYKEVRHDAAQVSQLLELFPGARVIVINRDLGQVVESLLRWEFDPRIEWERAWTLGALHSWRDNTFDMVALPADQVLPITYHALVQNVEHTLGRIERHLGTGAGSIDRAVMSVRIEPEGESGRSTLRPTITTIPSPVARFLSDEQTAAAVEAFQRYWHEPAGMTIN